MRKSSPPRDTGLVTNERILAKSVRLLDGETMVGVLPTFEALQRARRAGLDLVVISGGDEPVCRMLDADRYRFEKAKQEREAARRQREMVIAVKEVQLRPGTDDNDLTIKARRAREFLDEGDKVKVVVRFRGRERTRKETGYAVMQKFLAQVGEHKLDRPVSASDGDLMAILAPIVSKAEIVRAKLGK